MEIKIQKHQKKIRVLTLTDFVFPNHLHNAIEMIYVAEGSAMLRIQEKNIQMNAGDFTIIFPNIIHGFSSAAADMPPSNKLILCIVPLVFCGPYTQTLIANLPVEPYIRRERLPKNISYAMTELAQESFDGQSQTVYSALAQLILARYVPEIPLRKLTTAEHPNLTEQVMHYISAHFQEKITLSDLSRELCVSPSTLSHLFSEKMHTHFRHYLNSIRADYAAQQIRTTNLPITQIWADAGFESQRTFNRVFQELYHVTPTQYRVEIR